MGKMKMDPVVKPRDDKRETLSNYHLAVWPRDPVPYRNYLISPINSEGVKKSREGCIFWERAIGNWNVQFDCHCENLKGLKQSLLTYARLRSLSRICLGLLRWTRKRALLAMTREGPPSKSGSFTPSKGLQKLNQLIIPKTTHEMIIYHPSGLHEGITNGTADEFKSTFL